MGNPISTDAYLPSLVAGAAASAPRSHPQEIQDLQSQPRTCDACGKVDPDYRWHINGFRLVRLCTICTALTEIARRGE